MKNEKIQCRGLNNLQKNFREETRLVFENAEPTNAPASAPSAAPPESTSAEALRDLRTEVTAETLDTTLEGAAKELLGEDIKSQEVLSDAERLGQALDKLELAWNRGKDAWNGLLVALGINPKQREERSADIIPSSEPAGVAEENEPKYEEPEGWPGHEGKVVLKNWNRAKHAAIKLEEQPKLLDYIEKTAPKYNLRVSTLVTFIELESSFNVNSRPKDKKGDFLSSAIGLAQAIAADRKSYRRYRQSIGDSIPEPLPASAEQHDKALNDRAFLDPEIAIDFMGWHLRNKITEVNRHVALGQFPPEYGLTEKSDIRYLYMSYNNGAWGYLVLRRYIENPSEENKKKLTDFQLELRDGKEVWKLKAEVADRASEVAQAYEALTTGVEKNVRFESPPLAGSFIASSIFGVRKHPVTGDLDFHNGVDYAVPEGTPVLSVMEGRITKVDNNAKGNEGKFVTVEHSDGSISQYLHLSSITVSEGQSIKGGEQIGASGKTGRVTGPHLHFIYRDPSGCYRDATKAIEITINTKT